MNYTNISTALLVAMNLILAACAQWTSDYRGSEEYRYPDSYISAKLAKGSIEVESKGWWGDVKYKQGPTGSERQVSPGSSPPQTVPSQSSASSSPNDTSTTPYWTLISQVVNHSMLTHGMPVPVGDQNHSSEDIQLVADLLEVEQLRQSISDRPDRSMLPIKRDVELKCVLPPKQTVKETSTSLAATLEGIPQANIGKAQIDGRFASKVVRLFEQTERTIFLQYALFRMCEMTVNSPVEFRNVFPILLHRLIRQSATLNEQAAINELKRDSEEERTLQEKERTERAKLRMECISQQMKRVPEPGTEDLVKVCGGSENGSSGTAITATRPVVPVGNQ